MNINTDSPFLETEKTEAGLKVQFKPGVAAIFAAIEHVLIDADNDLYNALKPMVESITRGNGADINRLLSGPVVIPYPARYTYVWLKETGFYK